MFDDMCAEDDIEFFIDYAKVAGWAYEMNFFRYFVVVTIRLDSTFFQRLRILNGKSQSQKRLLRPPQSFLRRVNRKNPRQGNSGTPHINLLKLLNSTGNAQPRSLFLVFTKSYA